MLEEAQLQQVRDALEGASGCHEVRGRLERLEADELEAPIVAFGFHFLSERAPESRERRGGPWGPMVEMDGWQFPAPLDEIGEHVLDEWHQLLRELGHPAVQARCGDLLWVRRHGASPHESARAAVTGYLDLADQATWSDMERTEGLGRALEVARELRADDVVEAVARRMLDGATAEMETDERRPGITLRLLQPLVELPSLACREELVATLESAAERYGADPYIAQAVSESLQALAPAAERREMQREVIRRWVEESERGDSLLRLMRLQQALELASQAGLADEIEDLQVRLQSVSVDELDLKSFEVELPIPRDYADALATSVRDMGLSDGLRYLGGEGPPTGSPSEAEEAAAQARIAAPLLALIPRIVLGSTHGTPIFVADTTDRQRRVEMSEYRTRHARIWSVIVAQALEGVLESSRPTKDDLEAALAGEIVSRDIAERMAAAFMLYAAGDYDECAHLVVPRIEAAIRDLAAKAGLPVTKPPRGEKPGGVVGLGEILQSIGPPRLDEGWRLYLVTVLVDQLALNLRNEVAHGTRARFTQLDAALLLHVCCLLAGLSVTPPQRGEA